MTSIQQNRARCTIPYTKLQDLMKNHIGTPTDDWMEHDSHEQTTQHFFSFFKALAEQTSRVNKVAIATSAEKLWKMPCKKASLFGAALAAAFSHARRAGEIAANGVKLIEEVREVYYAMTGCLPGEKAEGKVKVEPGQPIKSELKQPSCTWSVKTEPKTPVKAELGFLKGEPVYNAQPCQVKKELGEGNVSPRKTPAAILQLYQVECPRVQTPSKKPKVDLHVCIYIIYICICISNIIQGGEGAWCSWFLNILH